MSPTRFSSAAEFRRWLASHYADTTELLIAFYRTALTKPGPTYAEILDEALCFGWIDGLRKRWDDESYTIRFTPRKRGSIWSLINVRHMQRLLAAGRVEPSGLAAWAARQESKTGVYSFEKPPAKFPPAYERTFKANAKAWAFFRAQAPWYQRVATHRAVNPKQEATRERWLQRLISASEAGRRIE